MTTETKYPFVSVIIPVYNGEDIIDKCLRALAKQTYSDKRIEVIVADNGSTDRTIENAREFPEIKIVEEREIRSSYAARNKAIRSAKGEIFAFIDADCVPEPGWLSAGVAYLSKNSASIAGGRVEFVFSEKRGWFERFDALYHMNQKETIKRGMAATANIFVIREAFDKVGFFKFDLISGGDAEWSRRAINRGFKLGYADSAVVKHPTRKGFRENATKEKRIGRGEGQLRLLRRGGKGRIAEIAKLLLFSPFDIIRYVWPVVKFAFRGKIRFYEPFILIPIAKLMFLSKRIGTIGFLLREYGE